VAEVSHDCQIPVVALYAESLAESLRERFEEFLRSKYVILAVLIDPRFKQFGFSDDVDTDSLRRMLRQEYATIKAAMPPPQDIQQADNDQSSSNQAASSGKRISRLEREHAKRVKNAAGNASQLDEVTSYFEAATIDIQMDPLSWWQIHHTEYPVLSLLARKVLAWPANSVPSEQALSVAGDLITHKRSRLKDNTIRASMCLNSWLKLSL
jgi:hypothetical protein